MITQQPQHDLLFQMEFTFLCHMCEGFERLKFKPQIFDALAQK